MVRFASAEIRAFPKTVPLPPPPPPDPRWGVVHVEVPSSSVPSSSRLTIFLGVLVGLVVVLARFGFLPLRGVVSMPGGGVDSLGRGDEMSDNSDECSRLIAGIVRVVVRETLGRCV